ncbi:MAG: nucleoside triphosphate pyrophosphohydrolase [Alphaproteobacteria bacterium]
MPESSVSHLLGIMAQLRDPNGGCPWDVEQTFATIAPHTIEEAYEVADAVEHGDMAALKEELGDLLLQVVFHAQMAREEGHFSFTDVVLAISDKLVRRHPHVFGEAHVATAEEQVQAWEALKAGERASGDKGAADGAPKRPSALDGVATALPALTRAHKLGARAARVGFDWADVAPVLEKVEEEIAEIRTELGAAEPAPDRLRDEVGDLLFACVNVARKLKVDPETALRHANAKFDRRFRQVEDLLAEKGLTPAQSTAAEMDDLWRKVKEMGENR